MILLPLFIFWARTPMHFGPRLRFTTFAAILLISIALPSIRPIFAAEGYGASNPPINVTPEDSNKTSGEGKPFQEPRHIREGTVFRNVMGRFTTIGSRWVFVPQRDDVAVPSTTQLESRELGQKNSSAIVFESRNGSGREISITTSTQPSRNKLVKDYVPDNATITALDLPQLIVTENLMLQRVVESIRADSSDDMWIVSGEVKEFFDDNVLMIRAAQRAVTVTP
jgi:hypothetical protein